MTRLATGLGCALLLGVSLVAQDFGGFTDDFLTDHEADVIRETQEPNERIKQYLHFARLRLELVTQALGKAGAGRSKLIHRNLEHYGRIIETIDVVIDDAAAGKAALSKGMALLAETEKEFLARLQGIQENPADDLWAYEFVLEDAIDITRDSMELALEDLGDRGRRIVEADAREEKERRAMMTPERRKEVDEVKQEQAKKESDHKTRRPTLLKPGEKLGEPGQPRERR